MAKYWVLKKGAGKTQLLEIMEAKNVITAQKEAVRKYLYTADFINSKLVVVGKAGYEKHYKEEIDG